MKNLSKWGPLKSGPHPLLKITYSDEEELVQMDIRDVDPWIPLILLRVYNITKMYFKAVNKLTDNILLWV